MYECDTKRRRIEYTAGSCANNAVDDLKNDLLADLEHDEDDIRADRNIISDGSSQTKSVTCSVTGMSVQTPGIDACVEDHHHSKPSIIATSTPSSSTTQSDYLLPTHGPWLRSDSLLSLLMDV